MYRSIFVLVALVPALLLFGVAGCGNSTKPTSTADSHASEAGHEHPSKGPHGGDLIELGNEEYHAEVVHDEQAKTVTVYILDSSAKISVPIDSAEVTINLKHEGRGEQFKLTASADQGDAQGKSSRFVSSDAELVADLDRDGAEAQLALTVNGKPYQGALEHHHE